MWVVRNTGWDVIVDDEEDAAMVSVVDVQVHWQMRSRKK